MSVTGGIGQTPCFFETLNLVFSYFYILFFGYIKLSYRIESYVASSLLNSVTRISNI